MQKPNQKDNLNQYQGCDDILDKDQKYQQKQIIRNLEEDTGEGDGLLNANITYPYMKTQQNVSHGQRLKLAYSMLYGQQQYSGDNLIKQYQIKISQEQIKNENYKQQQVLQRQNELDILFYQDNQNSKHQNQISQQEQAIVEERISQDLKDRQLNPSYIKFIQRNKNIPQYLLRRVVDFYDINGEKQFQQNEKLKKEVDSFIAAQKKCYESNKKYNNNLESMQKFYGTQNNSCDPKLRSQLFRKYTQKLIRQQIILGLFNNKKLAYKNIKAYMFTLKVQALVQKFQAYGSNSASMIKLNLYQTCHQKLYNKNNCRSILSSFTLFNFTIYIQYIINSINNKYRL